jgi:bacteriocin-like protein
MTKTRQKHDVASQLSDNELISVTGGEDKSNPLQTMGTDKAKTATKEAEKMWAYLRG